MNRLWNSAVMRWAVTLVWMGWIFFLSAQSKLPDLGLGPTEMRSVAGHLVVYGVLALLLQRTLEGTKVRRPALWAFVIAVLYGFSDELHQHFVPGRTPTFFDLATDAVAAVVVLGILRWRRARRACPAVATLVQGDAVADSPSGSSASANSS
jgi:hypothetical protein